MKNLKNRVAVITGAASGIGRALAVELAKEGCDLAVSDVNQTGLEETKNLAEAQGAKVFAKTLDVADKAAMAAYPAEVEKELGAAHIVINNAGVTVAASFEEHTIEDFEWLMGINFWGVLYGTKFFLPLLQKQDEGHIVNISSVFGLISVPHQSSYNAAKFAVRGLTESLRQELEGGTVGVSCVHPGGVRTNIARDARFKSLRTGGNATQFADRFAENVKVTPEEAAKIIVNGIKKKNERILIGNDAMVIDFVQRVAPLRYSSFVKLAEKVMQ